MEKENKYIVPGSEVLVRCVVDQVRIGNNGIDYLIRPLGEKYFSSMTVKAEDVNEKIC